MIKIITTLTGKSPTDRVLNWSDFRGHILSDQPPHFDPPERHVNRYSLVCPDCDCVKLTQRLWTREGRNVPPLESVFWWVTRNLRYSRGGSEHFEYDFINKSGVGNWLWSYLYKNHKYNWCYVYIPQVSFER